MTESTLPGSLRIALLGEPGDVDTWTQILAGRGTQVRLTSLDELGRSPVDLAVVVTSVEDAPRIAKALAGLPGAPPYALLAGLEGHTHPQTQLLKALAEAKRQWEGAFDAIVDPVFVLDDAGMVVRANLALARVLDQPIQKVVLHHFRELLGEAQGPDDPVAESLRRNEARTQEARYKHLPGIQQVTTSPLHDPGGRHRGLVVMLKDVTELHEQQERLLQAARLADIGQLAAGVAHEINTPLASIALRAESLLRSAEDPRAQGRRPPSRTSRATCKTIDEEIFRCKKIIGALLDFSRSRRPEVRAHRPQRAVREGHRPGRPPDAAQAGRSCRCELDPGPAHPARGRRADPPGADRAAHERAGRHPRRAGHRGRHAPRRRRPVRLTVSDRRRRASPPSTWTRSSAPSSPPSRSARGRAWASPSATAS